MTRPKRTLRERHHKAIAVIGSVALHGFVVWVLATPLVGARVSTREGNDDESSKGINIELMHGYRPLDTAPQRLPTDLFSQMSDPATTDGITPLEPVKKSKSLADIFGHADRAAARPIAASSAPATGGQTSRLQQELWKQVEPCWRRLADKDTVSVTLSASFSPMGNLATLPVVVRDSHVQPTAQRLVSEGVAMKALSECGPYLVAFGRSNIELDFSTHK